MADKIEDAFTAGVILKSGEISFINSKTGQKMNFNNNGTRQQSIGTVLNVCHDKNQQRFVLFLVQKKLEGLEKFSAGSSKGKFVKEKGKAVYELFLFTDRLLKLDISDGIL